MVGSGREVGLGGQMGVEIKTNSAQLKLELGLGLSLVTVIKLFNHIQHNLLPNLISTWQGDIYHPY